MGFIFSRWSHYLIFNLFYNHLVNYPSPINLNYYWRFGSLSGFILRIQLISGIVLSIYYVPQANLAFLSIEYIIRNVPQGWLLRYCHTNGASFFFIIVYLHLLRNFYYNRYISKRLLLWYSGIVILLLIIATGFLGYVLPWGQISLWGATVITNLISIIPIVGKNLLIWLWGNYAVSGSTLSRFFRLHFVLPFLIIGVVLVHLALLHTAGSTNPIISTSVYNTTFYPYFYIKDLHSLFYLLNIFGIFIFFYPNLLAHPDNYIKANILVTPDSIVPEWYFLISYCILRSVPQKALGVLVILYSFVCLFLLPGFSTIEYNFNILRYLFKKIYWFFVLNLVILGWLGQKHLRFPYVHLGQIVTIFYFIYLFLILPVIVLIESFLLRF